jgi:hypothetical protein
MTKHKFQQGANDWVMCSCERIFNDRKALDKHIELMEFLSNKQKEKEEK